MPPHRAKTNSNFRWFFPQETLLFAVVSALDAVMTQSMLLSGSFTESNPIARRVIGLYGLQGMFVFKVVMVLLIVGIVQIVARQRPQVARGVLHFATLVVVAVLLYSSWLMIQQKSGQLPSPPTEIFDAAHHPGRPAKPGDRIEHA